MGFGVTLRGRDQPGRPCDGVLLDVVAALELDAGRGRDDGHGHAVPPALLVSPGPGHQQQVLVLRLQTRLGRVNMCYCVGLRVLFDCFWPPMRPRHSKNYDKLLSEEVHQAPGPEHGA